MGISGVLSAVPESMPLSGVTSLSPVDFGPLPRVFTFVHLIPLGFLLLFLLCRVLSGVTSESLLACLLLRAGVRAVVPLVPGSGVGWPSLLGVLLLVTLRVTRFVSGK